MDDASSRDMTGSGLQKHGAMVTPAATMSEAARLLDAFHPDLLLGDIGLLEAGGPRRIRAVALTSYAWPDDRPSATTRRHVGKPVDIAELVTISTVARSEQGEDS